AVPDGRGDDRRGVGGRVRGGVRGAAGRVQRDVQLFAAADPVRHGRSRAGRGARGLRGAAGAAEQAPLPGRPGPGRPGGPGGGVLRGGPAVGPERGPRAGRRRPRRPAGLEPMIWHLLPLARWREDPGSPSVPGTAGAVPFVHASPDEATMLAVANAFYREAREPPVAPALDEEPSTAPGPAEGPGPGPAPRGT